MQIVFAKPMQDAYNIIEFTCRRKLISFNIKLQEQDMLTCGFVAKVCGVSQGQ